MEKFIKGRWFPLAIAIAVAFIIGILLFLCGIRITYAPGLENNWDAISAAATWAGVFVSAIGVVASFVAIWYAIQVPKKIAEEQNKIALFEQRYECFQFFERCHCLYKGVENASTIDELRKEFQFVFKNIKWEEQDREIVIHHIEQYEYILHQMQFLFPNIEEKDANNLYNHLQKFTIAVLGNVNTGSTKRAYIDTMSSFEKKYADIIWDSLTISNIK